MKKLITLTVAVLVFNLALVATASASTDLEKAAKRAEKVKAGIQKLGVGETSRVQVQLTDGTKLKGYISEIKAGSFVVTNEKTNVATEIPYPNAKKVQGNNLSTGAKIAIAAGIVLGILLIIGLTSWD